MDDKWLSVDEIADYLGVKRDTIYKWINRKQLPGHKVGRLWKFRKKEPDCLKICLIMQLLKKLPINTPVPLKVPREWMSPVPHQIHTLPS